MGRIGSAVARIAACGLGMAVVYHDIRPVGPFDFPTQALTLDELLDQADFLSLHVPLSASTRGMIDAQKLARCKRGAVLINTARGAVVDGNAVAQALTSGPLAAAALDVTDPEPLPADHPLLGLDRVLLTPHVAGRSLQALQRMNAVVEDVRRLLAGQTPQFPAEEA
jgi:phosphoglycerate dehydrogenase-like enzyme